MSFDLALLNRRITSLENNRGACLRFGKVTEVKGGYARVAFPDGEGVVSYLLPKVQDRVLKDQDIKMPDAGEPVVCLFRGQGFEEGIILGACYSPETPDPKQEQHLDYHCYEDGTELWYDRQEHKLIAKVKGDIEADVDKNIKAKVGENVELEVQGDIKCTVQGNVNAIVQGNVDATVQGNVNLNALGKISLKSAINITLCSPTITLAGLLLSTNEQGGTGQAVINGHCTIKQGGLDVPDNTITTGANMQAQGDVTAGVISLSKHKHLGVMSGSSTTDKPIGS